MNQVVYSIILKGETMIKRILMATAIVLLAQSAAWGSCKKDTADNQARVEDYVAELMVNPQNFGHRPTMWDNGCPSYRAVEECKKIMDRAEIAAKKGLKIEMPKFRYDGSEQ
jgi:hypothetical protein